MDSVSRVASFAMGVAIGLAASACSASPDPTSGVSVEDPSPSPSAEPLTADQQRAQFATVALQVHGAIESYQFEADERLPVVVIEEDSVDVGGHSFRLPIDGITVEIFGSLELFGSAEHLCVQFSRPGVGSAEGEVLYASTAGRLLDSVPCSEEFISEGSSVFPNTVEPGFYQVGAVHAEVGVCFNETEHVFKLLAAVEEPAWEVVFCSSPHQYEVYGVGELSQDEAALEEDEGYLAAAARCSSLREGIEPGTLGSPAADWVLLPFRGKWSAGLPKYQCIAESASTGR